VNALAYQRRGAGELLLAGHVDEGLAAARIALEAAGMGLAPTPRRALVALLAERARLRLGGFGFRRRAAEDIAASELGRIDLCWSLSSSLGLTDHIQGAHFQAKSLRLALRAGEPYRIARGLAGEAGFAATRGKPAAARVRLLLDRARRLADELDHPHALGMVSLMEGIAGHLAGEFPRGRACLEKADRIFRDRCTGVTWELDATRQFLMDCLAYLGDLRAFGACVVEGLRDAAARGDLYAATNLRTGLANLHWLVRDEPDRARAESAEALARWSIHGFHVQHFYDLYAQAQVHVYLGDGRAALERLGREWPDLGRSLLLTIQHTRIVAWHLRARAALAALATEPGSTADRRRLLGAVAGDARRLRREGVAWASAFAAGLEAAALHLRGRADEASARLAEAVGACERAGLALSAACLRHRLGELRGGASGAADVATARAWFEREGVKHPGRMAALWAPGFGPPAA
jgi:hypothetical protein